MTVSLVSWNVLADGYVRPSYYPGVAARCLAPELRRERLLRRLAALDADVICLQEVESAPYAAMCAALGPLGYHGEQASKRNRPDGCATFVRAPLRVLDVQALHYRDGLAGRPDSGHVGLITVLESAAGRLGVANTHFRWDPEGTPLADQVGYRQGTQLQSLLGDHDHHGVPWVVCGDFNATVASDLVRCFTANGYVDAYRDRDGDATCVSNGRARRIDFVLHAATLGSRPMPVPPIVDATRLPSDDEPSDHVAIGAWLDARDAA